MMKKRSMALLLMGLGLGLGAAGCSDDEAPDCGEPLLAGAVIDETALGFIDAEGQATDDAEKGPTLTSPPPSSEPTLTFDAPPVFEWSSVLAMELERSPRPEQPRRLSRPSLWARVSEWLVSSAHAHGIPFSGDAYWLQVTDESGACFTALTSELFFQTRATEWSRLSAGLVEVRVTSAVLRDDRVTEGPYRGPVRTFTLVE